MNYIAELRAFYDLVSVHRLSAGQIALWHALMQTDNKCAWAEWFTVSGMALELTSGLSRQGILKARNVLKQLGLLEVRTNGAKATAYRLIPPTTLRGAYAGGEDRGWEGSQDSSQASSQKRETLNKQDKTKQVFNKYGEFENVELTEEQAAALKKRFADWEQRIERLSGYMASTGRSYKDHYATILSWARREEAAATGTAAKTRGRAAAKPEVFHSGRYDYEQIERAAARRVRSHSAAGG